MKRALLIAVLMVIGVSAFASDHVTCMKAPGTVKIDGVLDEWTSAVPLVMDDESLIIRGRELWSGKADCSGRIYAMWDFTNLYLSTQITDDQVYGFDGMHKSYNNDGVEVQMDCDLESDWEEASYDADEIQFQLTVHTGSTGILPASPEAARMAALPQVWCYQPMREEIPNAKIAMTRTADGYILESAIPWSELPMKPRPGKWIGFGAVIDDTDDPNARTQTFCMSWPPKPNQWLYPQEMGRMIFVAAASDVVKPPVLKPLSDKPISFTVDARQSMGKLKRLWEGTGEGGETDPYMPEGYADRIKALGIKLFRADHLINRYGAFPAKGAYDWKNLDRYVDSIMAGGAQPLMCLSYDAGPWMHEGPAWGLPKDLKDWEEVVYQTTKHFNVDRKLGIKYWEVWNEPDAGNFWSGTFDQYLELYDAAAKGALRADPSIKFGGPGVSWPIRGWLHGLMQHCAEKGVRLDFVSWHSYDIQPQLHGEFIRKVKRWASEFPSLHPEFIIDEWNAYGGLNGLNDTEYDAAFACATIKEMLDVGLDRQCFFELRDGRSGDRFYGRWGLLAYDGTPKPVYNAFQMMSMLGDERLRVQGADPYVGVLASRKNGEVCILAWNLDLRMQPKTRQVKLHVTGLPAGIRRCEKYLIDSAHSNAHTNLTHAELEKISDAPVGSREFSATLTLEQGTVVMYRLM